MKIISILLGAAMALAATLAQAGETLLIAPPPAWVQAAPALAFTAVGDDPPAIKTLRVERQLNLGPEGDATYLRTVSQVGSALGMMRLGTIGVTWDPTRDTVTMHRVAIIREGQTIDLLARQTFTTIRREANLGTIVDGRLTATLQPEGLQVGDIVEVAYTTMHSDPVLKGRTDTIFNLGGIQDVGTLSVRALWPEKAPIAWRVGPGLPAPKVARRGGRTEVTLEIKDIAAMKIPSGAPRRYWPTREVEFSGFASWAEVAATVAPYFDKASTLSPDSPLHAEVAKIRALSPDPKVQATAALKLVQDQVRYLGLILADGGYTPVDADKTWARRFGECKAKTALLLALLRSLGIEAEAVLVNAYGDDVMDRSLPRLSAFNHVIVRARIGGQDYWMDGTQINAAVLDPLEAPNTGFGLPLKESGAQLVAMKRLPGARPETETIIEVDASAGIESKAPVKGTMILRGRVAQFPGMMRAMTPSADREKLLKGLWSGYGWIEVKTAEMSQDETTGETRISMTGVGKLTWWPSREGLPSFFVPDATRAMRGAEFKRDPGPGADAPFTVPFPSYTAQRFSMRLPNGGRGFTTPVADLDKTVAGRAYLRRTSVDGDRITIETSVRAVAPEFPAAEAAAATEALQAMAREMASIQAPISYEQTKADTEAWTTAEPKTALDYIQRGGRFGNAGRLKEALADFEKARLLDPKSATPVALRGLVRLQQGDYVQAKADFDEAMKIDPRSSAGQDGLARLALAQGRNADAVVAYTRAIDLTSNPYRALMDRSRAYFALGQRDKALADLAEASRLDPSAIGPRLFRSDILSTMRRFDEAMAELDAAEKARPGDAQVRRQRVELLGRMGRRGDAGKVIDAAIASQGTVELYLDRALRRPKDDLAGRLADLKAAEQIDATDPGILRARARSYTDAGKPAEAIAILTPAIGKAPDDWGLLTLRATAYVRQGKGAEAARDFARLRAVAGKDPARLNALCWTQATLGVELDAALADCAAALAVTPHKGEIVDSKAFVLLRLGRMKESVEAYDEALRLNPEHPMSLYGRGVAKLRLGDKAGGDIDLASATKTRPNIGEAFAAYGVTP